MVLTRIGGEEKNTTGARETLFDKVWRHHVVATREDGQDLLWIDRHLVHEGSHHAFAALEQKASGVVQPELTFAVADHYVPTRGRTGPIANPAVETMVRKLEKNARAHGIREFGLNDPGQGIVHVVGPEQGLTLPGLTVVCGDSHTSTHGALGAIAFGIGASEVAHVLMTQTLWQSKPRRMRIRVDGQFGAGVSAKDLALAIIARIGADGGRGFAIEYAGVAVRSLSMEGRLTLCNLSIESGARCGMIAPDEVTLAYVRNRSYAPRGALFDAAAEDWLRLNSDPDATFDSEVVLDCSEIVPIVTWGISPEDSLPVDALLPDPASENDAARAAHISDALTYMGLQPGQRLDSISIDRVFIGSCTNSRIEDLRAAAAVLTDRRARVPGLVSPGSSLVKVRAEQEGLDHIFRTAGLEWVDSGCSMCVGMNGDQVPSGERCASTTNRNFKGRQGPGARTMLMSPAMVAAAAVAGHVTDVRPMLRGANLRS